MTELADRILRTADAMERRGYHAQASKLRLLAVEVGAIRVTSEARTRA